MFVIYSDCLHGPQNGADARNEQGDLVNEDMSLLRCVCGLFDGKCGHLVRSLRQQEAPHSGAHGRVI